LSTKQPLRILVAPLDWGMGHTTRCIPIIHQILHLGHIPVFAGNEFQCSYIEETFGVIENIHLKGYNILFPGGIIPLIKQIPGILGSIKKEHKWLLHNVQKLKINGIISDNRYGLYHPEIPNVILTHQLRIQSGIGNFADTIIQNLHYRFLQRFNEQWIVDNPDERNIAGKLSHPEKLPTTTKFIGLLSRFNSTLSTKEVANNLLIILSGPEPQRTILSDKLWQQIQTFKGSIVFIEGTQNKKSDRIATKNIRHFDYLTHEAMAPLLHESEIVICRSGYSTIMDLLAMGKKAILIPTPGQTEQEYLGKYLNDSGIFLCMSQETFDLQKAVDTCKQISFNKPTTKNDFNLFIPTLEQWLDDISECKSTGSYQKII